MEPHPTPSGVREQILAAAVETASVNGIAKLSVGDVARRAGLSRQTLYRHFPSKDALVASVVQHETAQLIAQVIAATEPHDDAHDALEAALVAVLRLTREHPLLDRLLHTEPEALLPLLTTNGGPVMGQVRLIVEAIMSVRLPELDATQLHHLADIVARLLVSYAVSAPDDPPEVIAAFVADIVTNGAAITERTAR